MSTHDNGGPAFPAPDLGEQDFSQRGAYPGMTLRDYFAAKAMQGLSSHHGVYAEDAKFSAGLVGYKESMDRENSVPIDDVAVYAYAMADAMLKARGGAQ